MMYVVEYTSTQYRYVLLHRPFSVVVFDRMLSETYYM